MATREVQELAMSLFLRVAPQAGVLARNPEGDIWEELLCSKRALDDGDRKALVDGARNIADRCLVAAEAVLTHFRPAAGKETTGSRYVCPECGSSEVELSFPVWVRANDRDNRELWDLDVEASPEKDSDKGWCPRCGTNVLVRTVGVPHGS